MKAYILYIATLLAALALPANGQTGGIETRFAPSDPAMPYKFSLVTIGGNNGTVAVEDNQANGGGVIVVENDTLIYGSSSDMTTTTVKLTVTPDTGYIIREGYPKAYKTGETEALEYFFNDDASPYTFYMLACNMTVEVAYTVNIASIDTLMFGKPMPTVADALAYLKANRSYLPITLANGAKDSLKVADTAGWSLAAGTTFDPLSGAANNFTCTLASLPDSIADNGKLTKVGTAWTATVRIANKTQLTIRIEGPVTYTSGDYNDENILITPTGHLTWDNATDQIDSLTIEEGGQLTLRKPLPLTGLFTANRSLKNLWGTYAAPLALNALPAAANANETLYTMAGYQTAAAADQLWQDAATGTLSAATPHSLEAGKPLLIAIESTEAKDIAFTAKPATVGSTLTLPATVDGTFQTGETLHTGTFLFCVNPTMHNITVPQAYLLSDDGVYFELTKNAVVKPFRAYLVASKVTTQSVPSLRVGGIPTANEQITPDSTFRLWGNNGCLHLASDRAGLVSIYTASGQLVRQFTLDGEQTVTLGSGIYFVHSNNITYKVSL